MFDSLSVIEDSRLKLAGCELGICQPQIKSLRSADTLDHLSVDNKLPEAAVINDMIVSIVGGMQQVNKQAVKDSLLFASLAASKKYPGAGVEWYSEFKNVMGYCGWLSQANHLADYRSSDSLFTMEQEGLKILASAVSAMALPGPVSALMLGIAADALAVLQASGKPLRLFETSSRTANGAKFAIVSAVESADGEVVMALGAVNFTTALAVTNVLFWDWNSSSVNIKRAENRMALNQRHYESVKDLVELKLAGGARNVLANLEI